MKTLTEHLSSYASYHRDRRNIATHFLGIPMIVVGVATLLSRPVFAMAGLPLSAAMLLIAGALLFYVVLDLRYALAMAVFMGAAGYAGAGFAAQTTAVWLSAGLGLFVVGWVIQFIGHAYEGKKPAFVDDVAGFLVGPLFVTAEAGFALGLRKEVAREIERNAGPTHGARSTAPTRARSPG